MTRLFPSAVSLSHMVMTKVLKEGDQAIDATAGNGHDSLLLARLVGDRGVVYSIDLQQQAIANTAKRLTDEGLLHRVRLIQADNAELASLVIQPVKGVMFNLGYLPGADHSIITTPTSTCKAINAALELLLPGGVITVVVYYGHPGGAEERDAVIDLVSGLSQKSWDVACIDFPNRRNFSPFLITIQRRTGGGISEDKTTSENFRNN